MMAWSQSDLGPVTVTVSDQASLLRDLAARLKINQGFTIATLNLDHVVKLRRDRAFRTAYAAHTHVTADGKPIVWLSKLTGQKVSLTPGSELIEPLVALASENSIPIALYGSSHTALSQAATVLQARYPALKIAFKRAPKMGFDPKGTIAAADMEDMSASGARLCFIALGAPKQECLAAYAQSLHPQVGFVSIGAGLNFIARTEHRAPVFVRALAGEWLWRMIKDPKRLVGRYSACLLALPGLTLRALRIRWARQDTDG